MTVWALYGLLVFFVLLLCGLLCAFVDDGTNERETAQFETIGCDESKLQTSVSFEGLLRTTLLRELRTVDEIVLRMLVVADSVADPSHAKILRDFAIELRSTSMDVVEGYEEGSRVILESARAQAGSDTRLD